jgi:DNA-binding GntR family transcriptional regulator
MVIPRKTASPPCQHGMRRQTLTESLVHDVFQGRLRAGEHLVVRQLAEHYGVSPTPIREALITLAGVGIIDLLPNRGAVVRHVRPHEVREILQVRRALECEATRHACGRIDLAELHLLAGELKQLRNEESLQGTNFIERARALDSRLHDLIAESCGNAFLAQELGRLKILFRTFRDVLYQRDEARNDLHRLSEETGEHLAIVEALLAGNARAAARAMSRHIRSGSRYWSRVAPGRQEAESDKRRSSRKSKRTRTSRRGRQTHE